MSAMHRPRLRTARARTLLLAALLAAAAGSSLSAQTGPTAQPAAGARITPNFKDAEITQVIEAVAAATGRSIIVDPRVRAQVTMLSSTPMTPADFYEAFLALLQVYGFVAVPSGNILKIIPDANSRTMPGNDLPDSVSDTSDELVTQVVAVTNVSAAQLVAILRPLMPQNAHLAAYPASNTLILADRASNVNRMLRIIRRIDQSSDSDVEVVAMQNASAAEMVRTMTALNPAQASAEGGMSPLRVVADERSNSILLAGDKTQRLRARTLIAYLDTPLASGGDTRVRYLRYADAEKIAGKLKEQLTGTSAAGAAAGAAGGTATTVGGGTTIWAEPETNALVITAPAKTMNSLMTVIDKLDIRRAQVIVEAIIVEVSADKSAELGVNWLIDGTNDNQAVGGFIEPVGQTSIVDLVRAARDPATLTTVPRGTTVGVGRLGSSGVNFAAVLRALRGDSTTNIIATPSIVTMDNQEAEIKVAQEVPFVTGQYTSTGGNTGSQLNPFQTIQRQEVGTILKITPQINEGDAVMLKIEQESSSIAASSSGAVDLITNKRTISTNVLIEDGGTVVLGGLIQDSQTGGEQRVPFFGRIPVLGEAFRTRSAKKTKTNLMVFIQPRILRSGTDATIETNQKYNYIRDQQLRLGPQRDAVPLLPGERRAILPEIPTVPPPAVAPKPAEPPK